MREMAVQPASPDADAASEGVVVVTVTYGERRALLQRVLDSLRAQGVVCAVVVNNGAWWPVGTTLKAAYGGFVDVVEMGRNTGSASGFAAGMRRAIDVGAQFIWLLDDDNLPNPHCLEMLIAAYRDLAMPEQTSPVAVCAFRSGIHSRLETGLENADRMETEQCFLGFHILRTINKLLAKVKREYVTTEPNRSVSRIRLKRAAYGGLLFNVELIHQIGWPRSDFVLYEDDTEWTSRIDRRKGRIVLTLDAVIEDLEGSWVASKRRGSGFLAWVFDPNQSKVYYTIRNKIYLTMRNADVKLPMFTLNAAIYILMLNIFCLLLLKFGRLRLIMAAIFDGFSGRLGIKPNVNM